MIQEWDNLTPEEKFKKAQKLIGEIAEKIANSADNNIWLLKSIICNAIENLFHYINDSQDDEINWENPAVDLHYDINIDKNLELVYFTIDENDIKSKDSLNKKIVSVFVDLHNILLFESLCEETIILQQNNDYKYVINSENINNQIVDIKDQDEKLNKIIELTHNTIDIPFEISKIDDKKISCNLIIEFTPLIVDVEQHTGHYSIITSMVSNKSFKNFSIEEKNAIKERLIKLFKEYDLNSGITKYEPSKSLGNFIEMGFTGKLLIDKSLKSDFIGGNTLQISVDNPYSKEISPKRLIFNKSSVKLTKEEEKILYLYVIEGVKNYSEIAKIMFCSLQNIKNKAQSIQNKLGASNMAHAAYLYYVYYASDNQVLA